MTSRNDRHLEELPHSLLTEISSYLCGRGGKVHHTGSDILLAVALSASQSSWEKCQSTNTQQLLSPASRPSFPCMLMIGRRDSRHSILAMLK